MDFGKAGMAPKGGSPIYHEKQMKELCALHALNNLFQDRKAFSKKDLDDICISLSPDQFINPHRSVLGLGNYDVNVIMAALQTKNCSTVWFDKRKSISCLNFEKIQGFILNIPTDYKWGILKLPFKRKHWISIRPINNLYYNLDSKLDAPELIGKESELRGYLGEHLENKEKELLLVVSFDVERSGSWRLEQLRFASTSRCVETESKLCEAALDKRKLNARIAEEET